MDLHVVALPRRRLILRGLCLPHLDDRPVLVNLVCALEAREPHLLIKLRAPINFALDDTLSRMLFIHVPVDVRVILLSEFGRVIPIDLRDGNVGTAGTDMKT